MPRIGKSTVILLAGIFQLGCTGPLCKELLAPQWGGDGKLAPSQVVIFHGCHDGDTCTFSFPTLPPIFGDRIPIRLAGVDAPELHGHCDREKVLAHKAHAFTESLLVQAKQIEISNLHRDKYFRIDATVLADGHDLSVALLNAHLAVAYNGGTKMAQWC